MSLTTLYTLKGCSYCCLNIDDDDDDDDDDGTGGGGGSDELVFAEAMSCMIVKFLTSLLMSVLNSCLHNAHCLGRGSCSKHGLQNV